MATESTGSLAVLIDADNVSYKVISGLMTEVANYGTASVRRIYGDWTSPLMKGWREVLLKYSIQPIQRFAYTTGKNATDGAMIIDAMDLLYTGRFSGFCLVSSDSDFTRLASRIREQGITVYGFGKRHTNNSLIVACNKFVYFDALPVAPVEPSDEASASALPDLVADAASTPDSTNHQSSQPGLPPARGTRLPNPPWTLPSRAPPHFPPPIDAHRRSFDQPALNGLRTAISTVSPYEEDYVNLADVGVMLQRISPDLNPRNYGFQRLREFIEASGLVDVRMKVRPSGPPIALVRLKVPSNST